MHAAQEKRKHNASSISGTYRVLQDAHRMHTASREEGLNALFALRHRMVTSLFDTIDSSAVDFRAVAGIVRPRPADLQEPDGPPASRRRLASPEPNSGTESETDDEEEPAPAAVTAEDLAQMAGWSGQELSDVVDQWDPSEFQEAVKTESLPLPAPA